MRSKNFKALRFAVVLALIMSILSITSFAGYWVDDDFGDWYYIGDNGYPVTDRWVGNYYLGSTGKMLVNSWTPDGYYVGYDGDWDHQPSRYSGGYSSSSSSSSYVTTSGTYYGSLYDSGYGITHLDSVSISGDVLTVTGTLAYYPGDNWENTTQMSYGTYQFKLNGQTRYGEGDEEGFHAMSKSDFIYSTGPVLYITVANGVATELCYGA